MRRYLLWIVGLLLALLLSPVKGADVGRLQPIELLQVVRKGDQIVLTTDTGDVGRGPTLSTAWKNLKETTPGAVFLDTADYLLVTTDTEDLVSQLGELLRPSTLVCMVEQEVDAKAAAQWLSAHTPGVPLRAVRYMGRIPPKIRDTEGRFAIVD